ncbi:MAG: isocitrate lyase/PEP mutase family protein [Betaproteobacteria bacterium]|nr:isocitrate lyase/PEP mutase family protein [Betaproteobacteria bacterium]MDH5222085.1 isocitrate lyase/PEP mutase family protein [Betaproteobacteria bacterium]MDH5352296.1 isocitrate lyase/PEP mutase family protein [Betaproteobacteria bacterium]
MTLRSLLAAGEFVLAPGVFEMFSAKIADRMGFKALYMTGYGISASHLGVADAGLVTYRDMVERARTIAQGTRTPLIADADTGFGGLLNVRETVRGYEAAGVQAIQIEDQEMPKKCGHTPNRRVVPLAEAVKRVEVAVEARRSSDFLVIARTDARTALGLDEAIRRARAFAKAGADVLFVEAPESEEEFARIGAELAPHAKLLANMVPTGRSPMLPAEKLKARGFSIAIYPSAGMGAACAALEAAYAHLKQHGSLAGSPVPAYDMARLHELVGFPEVWDFERRHPE